MLLFLIICIAQLGILFAFERVSNFSSEYTTLMSCVVSMLCSCPCCYVANYVLFYSGRLLPEDLFIDGALQPDSIYRRFGVT